MNWPYRWQRRRLDSNQWEKISHFSVPCKASQAYRDDPDLKEFVSTRWAYRRFEVIWMPSSEITKMLQSGGFRRGSL